MTRLCQLYPSPVRERPLKGMYLDHAIHQLGSPSRPFVYANFLSSLDGRISLIDPETDHPYVPEVLTNQNDFRLFLELHAQADCLITHGGYLRALQSGTLGNILQVGRSEMSPDLIEWRRSHGMTEQPAIVITSASLDFPIHASIARHRQICYIATGRRADPERIRYWQSAGFPVLLAGHGRMVQGSALVAELAMLGYRSIYLIAGPQMLDTMLRERQLSRLYQTISLQLLGGETFHTLLPGPPLGAAGQLELSGLYYDSGEKNRAAQLFAQFETTTTRTTERGATER